MPLGLKTTVLLKAIKDRFFLVAVYPFWKSYFPLVKIRKMFSKYTILKVKLCIRDSDEK